VAEVEHPGLVEFYAEHRNQVADLYPSERRFLPWLAKSSDTILDVGCAAGGFADIWSAFNPDLRYSGIDHSATLIDAARNLHPECTFLVGDCAAGLPLGDRSSIAVSALGWLFWEPRYREALAELWRLSERFLLIDLRLHFGPEDVVGRQIIMPGENVPYICVSWAGALKTLLSLKPSRLLGYGYFGTTNPGVSGIAHEVAFATFVLEREPGPSRRTEVCLDLPFDVPPELASTITLYPGHRLRSFAPAEAEGGRDT